MKTREEIDAIKYRIASRRPRQILPHEYAEIADTGKEIIHFSEWAMSQKPGLSMSSDLELVAIHRLAVETGILDNMKLAERLHQIEQSIEEIRSSDND